MFDRISGWFKKRQLPKEKTQSQPPKKEQHYISADIEQNLKMIKQIFDRCSDMTLREFYIAGGSETIKAAVIYIDGFVDDKNVNDNILRASQLNASTISLGKNLTKSDAFEIVHKQILSISEVKKTAELQQLVNQVLAGNAAIFIDGSSEAIICGVKGWDSRSIEEPASEPLVRGPREGFTENIRTNTMLIRRRIKTSRLKMESLKLGHMTKTEVVIAYIDGIAKDEIVNEVRQRLSRLEIDGVLESGYIEELIEDQPISIFPQVNATERPDRAAASLLEGYVAIIVDTTPMAMIVPATFPQFLQTSEDYYNRYPYSTFLRLLRFATLNIALLLPSLYIAIVTFHQEMLPTQLLISIAAQREGVPFPAFVEAFMMEIVFEILREAGLRLPRPIGQAVSIVGALVIGQAAVSAGLVSSAMVMVVSLTAVASFTMPTISGSYAVRLLRFPMMILAATLGLFGIMAGLLATFIHLCNLRSFGVPYLSPFAPINFTDMKDIVVRVPWWQMWKRPQLVESEESQRMEYGQKPSPDRKQDKLASPEDKGGKGGA